MKHLAIRGLKKVQTKTKLFVSFFDMHPETVSGGVRNIIVTHFCGTLVFNGAVH